MHVLIKFLDFRLTFTLRMIKFRFFDDVKRWVRREIQHKCAVIISNNVNDLGNLRKGRFQRFIYRSNFLIPLMSLLSCLPQQDRIRLSLSQLDPKAFDFFGCFKQQFDIVSDFCLKMQVGIGLNVDYWRVLKDLSHLALRMIFIQQLLRIIPFVIKSWSL